MSTRGVIFNLVDGDTLPVENFTYQLNDGTPINLDAFSNIQFVVRQPSGARVEPTTTVVNAALGKFKVEWSAGQLVVGTSQAEIEFTEVGTGKLLTIPSAAVITLIVRARA